MQNYIQISLGNHEIEHVEVLGVIIETIVVGHPYECKSAST